VEETDLSVSPDDGAEQLPGAAAPVDTDHAQDLEEAETAQGGRGEHLAAGAEAQDHNTRRDDDYICTHAPRRRTSATNTSKTHTHPFKGPLSGTTRVSRYPKGKTNLDFTEARDSEWHWQWHQLGRM